jgi:hypothetical protein
MKHFSNTYVGGKNLVDLYRYTWIWIRICRKSLDPYKLNAEAKRRHHDKIILNCLNMKLS